MQLCSSIATPAIALYHMTLNQNLSLRIKLFRAIYKTHNTTTSFLCYLSWIRLQHVALLLQKLLIVILLLHFLRFKSMQNTTAMPYSNAT
jgi:hypothetical protein